MAQPAFELAVPIQGQLFGPAEAPRASAASRKAYTLQVASDAISPMYARGEALVCDPVKHPAPGDFVAVHWNDPARPAEVVRLLQPVPPRFLWAAGGDVPAMLFCELLSPPRRLKTQLSRVRAVHKVLGRAP